MKHLRKFLTLFLIMCPLFMLAQSHDFEIKNFQENMTDLSAISSSVKDINGKPTALIRFAVRDMQFEFDANLGIVKQEKKTGEVWLYVPSGTKRLTISHPHLGVLRGYKIPLSIKGKNTYDAEIEITNKEYLQTLYVSNQTEVSELNVSEDVEAPDSINSQTPDSIFTQPLEALFNDSLDIIKDSISVDSIPTAKNATASHKVNVYAGVGFNAISIMGPAISLGIGYHNIHLEASFTLGLEKAENIGINYTETNSRGFLGEAYDYSCNRLAIRAGYALKASKNFFITPQLGVAFNMISGDSKRKSANNSQFNSITQMSASVGLNFDLQIGKRISLYASPQYYFPAGSNDAYKIIKEADNKIKSWCEGLGINVGIKFHF